MAIESILDKYRLMESSKDHSDKVITDSKLKLREFCVSPNVLQKSSIKIFSVELLTQE